MTTASHVPTECWTQWLWNNKLLYCHRLLLQEIFSELQVDHNYIQTQQAFSVVWPARLLLQFIRSAALRPPPAFHHACQLPGEGLTCYHANRQHVIPSLVMVKLAPT